MQTDNTTTELSRYDAIAYWWNMGKKKLDFRGNLANLLKSKGIKVKKVTDKKHPTLDCFVFTIPNRITFKYFGHPYDGAYTALKLFYAYMGDKATVNICGREFTINH